MPVSIEFGDIVGSITDKMCPICDNFVYNNDAMDIKHNKFDVWVYLCLHCNARHMMDFCKSQAQRDEITRFARELEAGRFKRAQEEATRRVTERKQREAKQQYLFGEWDNDEK